MNYEVIVTVLEDVNAVTHVKLAELLMTKIKRHVHKWNKAEKWP